MSTIGSVIPELLMTERESISSFRGPICGANNRDRDRDRNEGGTAVEFQNFINLGVKMRHSAESVFAEGSSARETLEGICAGERYVSVV